ncbi:unnamed protein product [Paramecium primaurelia]|uniref:Uncharacterized protein n=1 Tax=Paramecium primaurelia TaxID=5886 RepID=A0A8S1P1G0_PARPR|nr:unnamed protein product [Paramecium primaurelia]
MEMCKEDIMNLKGIFLHHMMYKYYQYLNMSYKQYHKLSNQFQQQNSDLHKFSIQYQMCKQHTKQGRLNNLSQIYKTLEGNLSNYQKNYKHHIHQNKHHIYTLEKKNNLKKKYIKALRQNCGLQESHVTRSGQLKQLEGQSKQEPAISSYPGSQLQVTKILLGIFTQTIHQDKIDCKHVVGFYKQQYYIEKVDDVIRIL